MLAAAKGKGLETMSLRIGQLSGSTSTGAWNETDWVPIIIKSSIALKRLPELQGVGYTFSSLSLRLLNGEYYNTGRGLASCGRR